MEPELDTVNPVNVPTEVIDVCAAVDNVPVNVVADNVVADNEFIPVVIFELPFNTNALLAAAIPAVTPDK